MAANDHNRDVSLQKKKKNEKKDNKVELNCHFQQISKPKNLSYCYNENYYYIFATQIKILTKKKSTSFFTVVQIGKARRSPTGIYRGK